MNIELKVKNLLLERYPDDPAIAKLTQHDIGKTIRIHNLHVIRLLDLHYLVPLSKKLSLRKKS